MLFLIMTVTINIPTNSVQGFSFSAPSSTFVISLNKCHPNHSFSYIYIYIYMRVCVCMCASLQAFVCSLEL